MFRIPLRQLGEPLACPDRPPDPPPFVHPIHRTSIYPSVGLSRETFVYPYVMCWHTSAAIKRGSPPFFHDPGQNRHILALLFTAAELHATLPGARRARLVFRWARRDEARQKVDSRSIPELKDACRVQNRNSVPGSKAEDKALRKNLEENKTSSTNEYTSRWGR